MTAMWLLLHHGSHSFDVRVTDMEKYRLLRLFLDIFEESVRQDVFLPSTFALFIESPCGRVELVDDKTMKLMWGWNWGKDTAEIWVEGTDKPGVVFRNAVATIEHHRKESERKLKERQDELLRAQRKEEEEMRKKQEREDILRELQEQMEYTIAVEVPVVDCEDLSTEYVRIISKDGADEVFPGASQPQPTQESSPSKKPTSPKPKQKAKVKPTTPKAPKVPKAKKLTPKRRPTPTQKQATPKAKKPTPTTKKPTSTPQQPTPTPEQSIPPAQQPTPTTQQPIPPPQQPNPSPQTHPTHSPPPQNTQNDQPPHSPPPQNTQNDQPPHSTPTQNQSEAVKRKGARTRPTGFRVNKVTAKKAGTWVSKGKGIGRKGTGRSKSARVFTDIEDIGSEEESEDSDWEESEPDNELEEDKLDDWVDSDVEAEVITDDVPDLLFEECLDGSSKMDKAYKNGKIWTHQPYGSIKLEPWLIFPDKSTFLDVLRSFCIQEGFGLSVERADSKRYTAVCAIETCDWRIHASKMFDSVSWAIKGISGCHKTCGRLEENPVVTSEWLCKNMMSLIEANTEIPVETLRRYAQETFQLRVKKRLLYKVRSMAVEKIHGGWAEAYELLPRYAEMIKQTNPGSYALISWGATSGDVNPKFRACFFSFAAQVKGFLRGCRPIIGIDGAHLSGFYKGILLTAVGIDGNNEIFVLAYGIVDTESCDSWTHFMRCLRQMFEQEGCNKDDWTFISDRMKGVDLAVRDTFPRATRRVCCQHLYMNCKNNGFSGSAFFKLFWIAANAHNEYVYGKALEKITAHDPNAAAYLDTCQEQWSRHMFDPAVCCDHNTTNFVESFNACTKPYRDMPVFSLLEAIRKWCMERVGARFDMAIDMEDGQLTEYAKKEVDERTGESRFCYATACGGGEFEVRDAHVNFPIRLSTRSCGCGKWQISGIPCKHALRVIYDQRLNPIDFVSPFFKSAAYKLTYADHIHPMSDPTQWPNFSLPTIQPPVIKRQAGRPAKKRKRGPNEPRKGKRNSNVKCGKCREFGHNSRTCKNGGPSTGPSTSAAAGASTSQGGSRGRKRANTAT
ncbi:uncharacterized protein [Spinacia oleracea]|nr:uncharacterized protein LOC110786803 isoform X2 [Spinacia oleracea]